MKLYTELNAQEKFKRTLHSAPFCLIIIAILLFVGDRDMFSVVSAAALFVLYLVQFLYTYKKSKEK